MKFWAKAGVAALLMGPSTPALAENIGVARPIEQNERAREITKLFETLLGEWSGTVEKSPHRARGKAGAMFLPQQHRQFDESDIHLALDRRQDDVAIGFNAMRRRSPPCCRARAAPVSRHSRTQRTALAAAIPNLAAAARRDRPPSTAAITRACKSSDKDLAMHAGLPGQHTG